MNDSLARIPFTLRDTSFNSWADTIVFPVAPFPFPIHRSIVNHVAGRSETEFRINVVNPSAVTNSLYELTFADSAYYDPIIEDTTRIKVFTLTNLTQSHAVLYHHVLPDEYSHNIPLTEGFKIMRGNEAFAKLGLRRDSTRWLSSTPQWLRGDRFVLDEHSAFNGGATTGFQLGIFYLGRVSSSFGPESSYTVEVRFDSSHPQKAYRLRRNASASSYIIQSTSPFVDLPFSVWDVMNPASPRQLTLAWRDQDDSRTWNPTVAGDGLEIVFIYNKTYDPTGTTQFSMPPNAIPNECTIGARADIVYGLSLRVVSGHVLNESPGTLRLRPYFALTNYDRFTFNPTIVVGVPGSNRPESFALFQNYPNPFNPVTTIRYSLPVPSKITLTIFNILGQKVKTLVDEVVEAGEHRVRWDGTNSSGNTVATGVYFYRIEAKGIGNNAPGFTNVKKMLLHR
jgi:hypothetical protein